MKKRKWIVCMMCLMILFTNMSTNIEAASYNLKITYPDGYSTGRLIYGSGSGNVCEDGKDHRLFTVGGIEMFLGVFWLNNELVYCIQPFVATKTGYTYSPVSATSNLIDATLKDYYELASYFGYGYNNDYSTLTAIATQIAIWEYAGVSVGQITNEVRNKVNVIKQRVSNYLNKQRPSFHGKTFVFNGVGEANAILLEDTNKVIQDWIKVNSEEGLKYEIDGNTIKVWVETPFFNTKTIEYNLYNPNDTRVSGNSVVYINPNNAQRLAKFKDPVKRSANVSFKMANANVEIVKYKSSNSDGTGSLSVEEGATFIVMEKQYIDTYGSVENAYAHKEHLSTAYYDVLTTDENGYAKSKQLSVGEYYIKQIKGSVDTVLYEDELTFKIDANHMETKTFTLVNKKYATALKVVKTDMNGEVVVHNPMRFKIKDVDGNDLTYTINGEIQDVWSTDSSGSVILPFKLDAGKYYLEEIEAPQGFLLQKEDVSFVITNKDGEQAVVEVKMQNEMPTAAIKIYKQFEGEASYVGDGVKFALYANSDIVHPSTNTLIHQKGEKIGEYALDANNTLYIDNLAIGKDGAKYMVKEIQTYENYILDREEHFFDFTMMDAFKTKYKQTKTIKNEVIKMKTDAYDAQDQDKTIYAKGQVELQDYVYYEGLIKGKTYVLKGTIVDKESGEVICDENGDAIYTNMEFIAEDVNGVVNVSYTFLADHLLNKEIVIMEELYNTNNELLVSHRNIEDANQTIVILPVYDIKVYKVDEKTFSLIKDNFKMALYYDMACTDVVDEIQTNDATGILTFKQLPYGVYYLKEIKAPKGYALLKKSIKIEICEDGIYVDGIKKSFDEEVVVFNEKIEAVETKDTSKSLYHLYAFVVSGVSILYFLKKQKSKV